MELFEDLEGTGPETARDAIASWDDSSIPGRPAGPESTETRYLVRDTGPGPRFPGSGPRFRYHHRPGIAGFSTRLNY